MNEARAVDPAVLAYLEELGEDDDSFVRGLVDAFARDMAVGLASLRTALEAKHFDDAAREAHRLASGAAELGATSLSAQLRDLEARTAAGPYADGARALGQIETEYDAVCRDLDAYLLAHP